MKVYLDSIGCRLNQSEMDTLGRELIAAGHELVATAAEADKVVLNSCAVTKEAEREARQRTRKMHQTNQTAEIVLTGCYATVAPQAVAQVPGVSQVVSNAQKSHLLTILDPQARPETIPLYEQEPILRDFRTAAQSHTRAFIKVQDGCDNKCTFCITTIARGEGQSRPVGDVVAEIHALAQAGYQEAVLTGVHLGSYGQDLGLTNGLKELVETILRHTDIPRLRLSSLEPWDIAEGFFTLWHNPRLLPHLHLPLQSGSDAVLRRMARRTRRDSFRALVRDAQENIPQLNLTSDMIVGFPGETAEDFAQSVDFVQEMGFSRLHVFPYSTRPGTAAAGMPGQLPNQVKKERVQTMMAVSQQLSEAYHQRWVGQTLPVLWESVVGADDRGLKWTGYTHNYVRVLGYGPADLRNQLTSTNMVGFTADWLVGEIVD